MEGIILFLLVVLIFYNISKRDLLNIISPIFLISVLFFFLYVVQITFFEEMYYSFGWVRLKGENNLMFVVLAFLSLLFFTIGHDTKKNIRLNRDSNHIYWSREIENYSILIGFFGLAMYAYFISRTGFSAYYSGHHGEADFDIGAQFYYMRYFIFTSLLLLFNKHLYSHLSLKGKFVLLFFLGFIIMDAVLRQQRGSWIRLFSIFLISFLIHQNNKFILNRYYIIQNLRKYSFTVILAILGVFSIVIMVPLRKAGGDFSKLFNMLLKEPKLLFVGSGISIGNEYVTAYNAFLGFLKNPDPDFGLKWLVPIVNFIPRSIWEEKPYWEDFSTSVFEYIDKYSLITHAQGSAETGLIDAFFRFYWYTPIFFFILGRLSKGLFLNSLSGGVKEIALYVSFYIGLVYFLTQNMFPFIVFGIFMYIPIGIYSIIKRWKLI